jgi:hypothetical protein
MANTRRAQAPAPRKRYRKPGSVAQMRGMLWEALLAASRIVEDPAATEDRKLKSMHAMAQLSGCYLKAVEVTDLASQIAELRAAVQQHQGRR